MKRTNYLEAVGLILIGFGLYETIYTRARVTPLAAEWGLTTDFDRARFLAVILNCVVVALSLIMIQIHQSDQGRQPISFSDTLRQMRESLRDWRGKMAPIALGLQFFSVSNVVGLFSIQAAISLLIGFVFVDLAILFERRGWL